ncbi:hypothetical protein [Caballeronia novacaledonica]|uniref:hypothetical protein n=1 Tax=Caballeronia novacaledonica TaxID=1544861 RepID=UPI001FE5B97E|nr:hypothetical protein [Caballeronia novacaledonica]
MDIGAALQVPVHGKVALMLCAKVDDESDKASAVAVTARLMRGNCLFNAFSEPSRDMKWTSA